MSTQDYWRLSKEVEQLKGALQSALERISALEGRKEQRPVAALLSMPVSSVQIPAEVLDRVDKRRREWRDKKVLK